MVATQHCKLRVRGTLDLCFTYDMVFAGSFTIFTEFSLYRRH